MLVFNYVTGKANGYDKFVLKSIYKSDPDKQLFFGKKCQSTDDLTADSGQKELLSLLLTYEPVVYSVF